ncbi:MAG TPA: hypothetical protein VFM65_00135 [Flavobacteriaceae bacterium]|nr:hypothetical protein [Flavobacteriaceae bacterium]
MKTIFNISLFLFFLLFASSSFAQATSKKTTINEQFNELLDESNSYKDYKVVKKSKLEELQKNTNMEISQLEKEIDLANKNIAAQKKEISGLKASLKKTQDQLSATTKAKNEIAFLGIPMNKATFRTTMWCIILILVIFLGVFAYKFKNSNIQTQEAQKNQQEIEEEYEAYRKTALEKQQKMGRMLQDERNKSLKMAQK